MFNLIAIWLLSISAIPIYTHPTNEQTQDSTIRVSPEHFDPIESLYHSQDKTGHYIYGYATPTASFKETHTANGTTQGGYSYIDADGKLQTVQYIADPLHGFRVAASNLPTESEDITLARMAHLQTVKITKKKLLEAAKLHAVAYSNPVAIPYKDVQNPVTELPEVAEARAKHLAILRKAYVSHLNALRTLPQPVQLPPEIIKAREEHLAKFREIKTRHDALKAERAILSPVLLSEENVFAVQTKRKPEATVFEDAKTTTPMQYRQYADGYVEPISIKSETQSINSEIRAVKMDQ